MAPARLCARNHRYTGRRCPDCSRGYEQGRGSAHARGYGAQWEQFRSLFVMLLAAKGIPEACGSSLPGGPNTKAFSACAKAGRLAAVSDDGTALHLDHEPPLRPEEREDMRKVNDPLRVGFLCRSCHSAKTKREQHC
jgi:hypothetical protein